MKRKSIRIAALAMGLIMAASQGAVPAFAATGTQDSGSLEKAKAAYEEALADRDAAAVDLDAARSDAKAARAALEAASKKPDQIRASLIASAQQDQAKKKTASDSAQAALQTAKDAQRSAQTAYDEALAGFDETALNRAVTDADQRVTKAEAARSAAQTAKDQKQADYDNAGRNFINGKAGTNLTVEALTGAYKGDSALSGYANTAAYETALASALTVDNLMRAADLVEEGNQLRAAHGSSALKINYRLMSFAATSAAVSYQIHEHAVMNQIVEGGLSSVSGSIPASSENLAWSYTGSWNHAGARNHATARQRTSGSAEAPEPCRGSPGSCRR